jgi:hypothetical protein
MDRYILVIRQFCTPYSLTVFLAPPPVSYDHHIVTKTSPHFLAQPKITWTPTRICINSRDNSGIKSITDDSKPLIHSTASKVTTSFGHALETGTYFIKFGIHTSHNQMLAITPAISIKVTGLTYVLNTSHHIQSSPPLFSSCISYHIFHYCVVFSFVREPS